MSGFSILRIKKLKSWGAVAGSVSHNARGRETLNADPAALHKNRFLIGSLDGDPVAVCKAKLGGQKVRKNAVYGIDGYLGASPEYFRPNAPDKYGAYDEDRLNNWIEASLAWLNDRYGDRVINAVLHLDEATPHIQFLLLPLDGQGKLNCRAMFGGKKYVLSALQTDYADAVAHLGLQRGRKGSKATHMDVADYYAVTQSTAHSEAPQLPTGEDIQVPEPPGTMARLKTDNLVNYAKEAVQKNIAVIEPVVKSLSNRNDILTTENVRLKEEREQLKDSNSKLSQDNAAFKTQANRLRGLNLDLVLVKMYGAVEAPESQPERKERVFELPDGTTIEYTADQWREPKTNAKGKGAINLVMHLSGYGQDNYQQAVRDLGEVFSDREAAASLVNHQVATAEREAKEISRKPFQMPQPVESTWPKVREHLINKLKLPAPLIDQLHKDGLLFSDRLHNCVFARAKESGVFKIGTSSKSFSQTLGRNGEPLVIQGTDEKVFITKSPLDALAIKVMQPESTILATGGYMPILTLAPYLAQKELFLAHGQELEDKKMFKYLAEHFSKAKRFAPTKGKNWSEDWIRQMEEKERAEIAQKQEIVSTQNCVNTKVVDKPGQTRSSPAIAPKPDKPRTQGLGR